VTEATRFVAARKQKDRKGPEARYIPFEMKLPVTYFFQPGPTS
jgi:hypothetical protein